MPATNYRQVIGACFPELLITSCVFHSQGWDSAAVLVNDELIFRFPKRRAVEPQYRKECLLLPTLADKLALATPRFSFIWPGGRAYPHMFVGYTIIPGRQLNAPLLASLTPAPLAAQLGQALSALHSLPLDQAAAAGVGGGGAQSWRAEYQALYEQVRARVFPLLPKPTSDTLAARWRAFLQNGAHFEFRPALVHRDLNDEHILVDPARNLLTGIIDWGDAAIGDPAIDFAGLYADLGPVFTERVLGNYQPNHDPTLRERATFYVFVGPFHEVLFGLDNRIQQHIDAGLARLQNVTI